MANVAISNVTATWNNGATIFSGIKLDATDTASAAGSMLLDLRVGGSQKLSVLKDGTIQFYASGSVTSSLSIPSTNPDLFGIRGGANRFMVGQSGFVTGSAGFIGWSSGTSDIGNSGANTDTKLTRVAAGVVKIGNGSSAIGAIVTAPTVVASLPAAATAGAGARAFVTDATASTFASTVAGGGSTKVPVYSDGTNWLIG